MGGILGSLHHVRAAVPARALPGLVRRRVDKLWEWDEFRVSNEAAMTFLLEHTERADEAASLARGHAEHSLLRNWLRYHPRLMMRQQVRDVEWLTTRRDRSRPTVLSFMHHHQYYGMFGSLRRHGLEMTVLSMPWAFTAEAPPYIRQQMQVIARGGAILPAGDGTDSVVAKMKPGVTMAIASDVAGHTPVTFLGRQVLGSFGAARIAMLTNSPVTAVTSHRDGAGSYLQVHEPLEPADYADPAELLAAILAVHEPAVLAWPEAVDQPLTRWGHLDQRPASGPTSG
ncbi:MAG: hypothetical protein JWQ32_2458 [Marmoricola sp.]|nr:hypothetical protein [Marmoricola sp.]